jgi:hypothetical protein
MLRCILYPAKLPCLSIGKCWLCDVITINAVRFCVSGVAALIGPETAASVTRFTKARKIILGLSASFHISY